MADRLFLGVPLTAVARGELEGYLERGFPGGLPGRLVPPDNWHVTLRFLGDVSPEEAERLRGMLAARRLGRPFEITLDCLGAFPDVRRGKVLWTGVGEGREALVDLADTIESCVRGSGLAPEKRPYSPHLTLARLRDPADLRELLEGVPAPRIRQSVADVTLFRSRLGGPAPRYEVIERFPL